MFYGLGQKCMAVIKKDFNFIKKDFNLSSYLELYSWEQFILKTALHRSVFMGDRDAKAFMKAITLKS